jgi:hypothetical protein
MFDKPTSLDWTALFVALALNCYWAYDSYCFEPNRIPFEPIIGVAASIFAFLGYLFWKKNKKEKATIANNIKNSGTVEGDVIIGNKINRQINQGKGSTYNENN